MEENLEKEIQIKAETIANKTKTQILANTSHDLFENTIEQITKDIENKQIELILNYDIETLPRYIKSNPERIKITEAGEIIVYVSIKSQNIIDDNEHNAHSHTIKKDCLLIELHNTGNEFNNPVSYMLPPYIILKRILVIHPVESARNAILKYLKMVKKDDAFDTLSEVFIRLYEKNKNEIMKDLLELREIDLYGNDLFIIFIVSSDNKKTILAENLILKSKRRTAIISSPITWQKITKLLSNLYDNFAENKI
ncbi:hypothetical protein F8M41_017170 [Gigaspora margarita]|uniref:Uncharacterized protein n=1 Tax=Gigaspora margarita TaxID=4874 RepID=A0A8H4ANJ7_GIGMA|nr:hypothetical protein F8M41_017170 [Gigaspora margarita]